MRAGGSWPEAPLFERGMAKEIMSQCFQDASMLTRENASSWHKAEARGCPRFFPLLTPKRTRRRGERKASKN